MASNNYQRQYLIDAALTTVHKARVARGLLDVESEADQLRLSFPASGMSGADVREYLARLAVDCRVSVAFG